MPEPRYFEDFHVGETFETPYRPVSEDEIVATLAEPRLALTPKQKERWHKKCLCLVGFTDVTPIGPHDFEKQSNMDDWLIVEKLEDVLVGTSIPYNYEKSKF